jgi:hypothetical protein
MTRRGPLVVEFGQKQYSFDGSQQPKKSFNEKGDFYEESDNLKAS